jgi:hypothetical protein
MQPGGSTLEVLCAKRRRDALDAPAHERGIDLAPRLTNQDSAALLDPRMCREPTILMGYTDMKFRAVSVH